MEGEGGGDQSCNKREREREREREKIDETFNNKIDRHSTFNNKKGTFNDKID